MSHSSILNGQLKSEIKVKEHPSPALQPDGKFLAGGTPTIAAPVDVATGQSLAAVARGCPAVAFRGDARVAIGTDRTVRL
jgi:hypothetical protein